MVTRLAEEQKDQGSIPGGAKLESWSWGEGCSPAFSYHLYPATQILAAAPIPRKAEGSLRAYDLDAC